MDPIVPFSPLAIGAAAVVSFVLGGLWFAVVVPRPYNVALGRAPDERRGMPPLFLVGPFLCGLASAITSAILLRQLGVQSLGDAALFGGLIGLGYGVATSVNTAINPNMPRPLLYGLVCAPYFLVNSIATAVILTAIS
jgi:hypothetical protein